MGLPVVFPCLVRIVGCVAGGEQFTIRSWARIMPVVGLLTITAAVPVQAGNLTTFETYAGMTKEEQNKVRSRAAGVIFKDVITKGDKQQLKCMDKTFLKGPKLEVQLAHARLRGRLEAAVENPNPKGRVEYLVAHHLREVCPPTENLVQH